MMNSKGIELIEAEAAGILAAADLVVTDTHVVYKAGKHGDAYIDKEGLVRLGISGMDVLLRLAAEKALIENSDFDSEDSIGVLGPAYGAVALAPLLALHLEKLSFRKTFFPARTELETDATGKRIHVIPEKLRDYYVGKPFVIVEDIVNNGTTLREVGDLLVRRDVGAKVLAAISLVDRGDQTAESLGVPAFYPLLRVKMPQHEAKDCPLCSQGIPLNTKLGKGARWVKLFGQPPYPPGTDFLPFWK